jgi:hypothetical protein
MNTTSQSTEHIRKHRTGRRPHRRLSGAYFAKLSRKVKGKINLTTDQEREFDALVTGFTELRDAHKDRRVNEDGTFPFEAAESTMAEAMEKASEIHKQVEIFRWTLSEKQQAVFDKLMKRRGHRGHRRHCITNKGA